MAEIQIDQTAYHEAGHALISKLKEMPVLEVYSDGEVGYTLVNWEQVNRINILYFYLAGEVAERILSPERYSPRASYNDRAYAANVLYLISSSDEVQVSFWNKAVREIEEEFSKEENKQKIRKIAEALTRKQTLSKEEFEALV